MVTVQRQLATIVLLTIGVVVLLTTGTFFAVEYVSYRRIAVETAYPLGESLGINLRSALTIRDVHAAREILATLLADSTIEAVFLFDRKDAPFSFAQRQTIYNEQRLSDRPDNLLDKPTIQAILAAGEKEARFTKGHLAAFVPIVQDGRKIGTVYIVANLEPLSKRLWWWGLCAVPLVAVASGIGVILSARMQRRIADPLERLTEAMRVVSREQDYALRVDVRSSTDEIAALVNGFNEMLEQISGRDRELAEINATLEERVRLRTEELRNSESKFRTLFEESPVSLWEVDFSATKELLSDMLRHGIADVQGYLQGRPDQVQSYFNRLRVIDVNQRTLDLFHCAGKEILSSRLDQIFPPSSTSDILKALVALAEERSHFAMETESRTLSGETVICSFHWAVMPGHESNFDRVVVSIEDITERRRMQERLQASLHEKEVLLGEVHHRVKNNLQVIASLLGMQMKKSADPATTEALQVSLSRVRTISLIHEKLYARESAPAVELGGYLTEIAHDIFNLHNIYGARVSLQVEVEPVNANLDILMAMALVVNELLTNALKYAFVDGRGGTVAVTLRNNDDGLILAIADNGVGLPTGMTWENTTSLGLRLVNNLARQIGGVVEMSGGDGTRITLRCPPCRI